MPRNALRAAVTAALITCSTGTAVAAPTNVDPGGGTANCATKADVRRVHLGLYHGDKMHAVRMKLHNTGWEVGRGSSGILTVTRWIDRHYRACTRGYVVEVHFEWQVTPVSTGDYHATRKWRYHR